jgi:DNA-binding response OmpR family regulator
VAPALQRDANPMATAAPPLATPRSRVLVVVDDASLAELLLDALGEAGHEALVAESHDAVVRLLTAGPFHTAIVDLDTRSRDTVDLVGYLRRCDADLKVIVLLPCGGDAPSMAAVPYHLAIAKPARLQALLSAVAVTQPPCK